LASYRGTDWLRGGGYVAQIRMNVVGMRNRTDASAGDRTSVIQRAKLEDLEDALIISIGQVNVMELLRNKEK